MAVIFSKAAVRDFRKEFLVAATNSLEKYLEKLVIKIPEAENSSASQKDGE